MNLETADNLFAGGLRHHRAGRIAEAEPLYRQTLLKQPNHADAIHLLGVIELQNGRIASAISLIENAIAIKPAAEFFGNYGRALASTGQLEKAVEAYRKSISLNPELPQVPSNLGIALFELGRKAEALEPLKKAVALNSDLAIAQHHLGLIYLEQNALGDAIHAFSAARQLRPSIPEAHNNLGIALFDAGMINEAIACYDRAMELRPEYVEAYSNKLYALNFLPGQNPEAILAEHRKWNRLHAEPLRAKIRPHENDADPTRKLRIGFVSADFRRHVVGWNLLRLFQEIDPNQFEIFCYSNVKQPDAVTAILQSHCTGWRDISVLDDDAAGEMIRRDHIDILIDLSLHMARNRLLVMARKPAPVQATYLGYAGTTGLEAIDYRFSDPQIDPLDSDLTAYSEKTIRLPKSYWCYRPWDESPAISPLPADSDGFVTFGCLNNFSKIAMATPEHWIAILKRIPNSRLIFHSLPGPHVHNFIAKFTDAGIDAERITIAGRLPLQQYLQTYNSIDIALDSFPHAGGITTCDAAWMGVPTVTLRGQTAVGRGGCSILKNLDLADLIANNTDQYVEIAANLAENLPRLWQLRPEMRSRMMNSPLMNSKQFARDVESAFRQMWQDWCQKKKP